MFGLPNPKVLKEGLRAANTCVERITLTPKTIPEHMTADAWQMEIKLYGHQPKIVPIPKDLEELYALIGMVHIHARKELM